MMSLLKAKNKEIANKDKIIDAVKKILSYRQIRKLQHPLKRLRCSALIRGLFGHCKQPVYYDFDCAMTKAILEKKIF